MALESTCQTTRQLSDAAHGPLCEGRGFQELLSFQTGGFLEAMRQAAWVNLLVNNAPFLSIIGSVPSLVSNITGR